MIGTVDSTKVVSNLISYQYLPIKPSFTIKSGTCFDINNPQIVIEPNENLGSCVLGTLTNSDLSFNFELGNTSFNIQSINGNEIVSFNGNETNENGLYSITLSGQNYIISFNPKMFTNVMSEIDPSGN
ncbi:hypothetical protein IKS57_00545 [bacterium]|nr:hypothetical protein [bacterium]